MKIGSISHEELVKAIADLARTYGWRVAGFRGVRIQRQDGSIFYQTPVLFDARGWPDLVLLKKAEGKGKVSRRLAIEVKCGKDTLKPEQQEWLELMDACGFECWEWREVDWIDGTILGVLA